jgi:hypothetical protein
MKRGVWYDTFAEYRHPNFPSVRVSTLARQEADEPIPVILDGGDRETRDKVKELLDFSGIEVYDVEEMDHQYEAVAGLGHHRIIPN